MTPLLWAEIWIRANLLHRLARVLRRTGNRLVDLVDGGARKTQSARRKAQQRQAWRDNARIQSQVNAAELQSNPLVLSQVQEMIASRIGRPVRHVRSEPVLRSGNGIRAHAHRRSYCKHWFEVSGALDEKRMPLLDSDGLLGVFVKSASKLGLSPQLEFILSEQGGNGFRAPYFFGSFTASDLKIGIWEAVDTRWVPFQNYRLQDQERIVEAIAAANAIRAEGMVPALTKSAKIEPRWLEDRYKVIDGAAHLQWKELYTRTIDVMRHQNGLVQKLHSTGNRFLTHNDLRVAGNISVPPSGDVVVYDWEVSTLGAPGADLGVLARVESGAHLLSCYVSKMARHGFDLDTGAVRFTLEVLEGLRSLRSGWRNQRAVDVETGLALLNSHLSAVA